VPEEGGKQF
jgi:hypothetical protein